MRVTRRGIIVVLLVLIAGAGAVFGTIQLLSGEQVLYLRADQPGPNPFTEPAVVSSAIAAPTSVTPGLPGVAPGSSPARVPGPGECDQQLLIGLLNQRPEAKAAWGEAFKFAPGEVESYIRGLVPVLLNRDVRVTGFGFKQGKTEPIQAILAAQSALLINSAGEPVVRCYGGNPLGPPRKIEYVCKGCPEDFKPPAPCNGTCYAMPTTTTTLPPTTTTLQPSTTVVPTTAARPPTTRKKVVTTSRSPSTGATAVSTSPSQATGPPATTGTLFPPNTQTFAPPAPSTASTTTSTTIPPGGPTRPTTTTTTCQLGPLCELLN